MCIFISHTSVYNGNSRNGIPLPTPLGIPLHLQYFYYIPTDLLSHRETLNLADSTKKAFYAKSHGNRKTPVPPKQHHWAPPSR